MGVRLIPAVHGHIADSVRDHEPCPGWLLRADRPGREGGRRAAAGYVVKQKDGRRNRYQIQAHLPLPEPATQEPAIGDVLALLAGTGARLQPTGTGPA